jgi:hypothetical protein
MTTNADGGVIDPAVRNRVMRQIEHFERALDEAEQNPSSATQDKLREAGDELMHAVAAVMFELGKLPSS